MQVQVFVTLSSKYVSEVAGRRAQHQPSALYRLLHVSACFDHVCTGGVVRGSLEAWTLLGYDYSRCALSSATTRET